MSHRLAFYYVLGWCPEEVDHINHVRDDNRWINLRAASKQENHRNRKLDTNNKSGFNGVTWYKNYSKWLACIGIGGKQINLGYFENKDDAIAARKAANIKYGFHPNHGE